jgi:acyl-CoA synthetase (AMP-forming)/AMP-acid ligase II
MNTWENNLLVQKYTDAKDVARIVDYDCISRMIEERFKEYKENPAIVDAGKTYTYKELDQAVGALRKTLLHAGLQAGDRVGVFYPNSVDFVVAALAVITSGAVAVLLPYQLDEMTLLGCSIKYK